MLVGHKPFGDSPLVIRGEGIEVIDADTSYSDTTAADNRGVATPVVTVVKEAGRQSQARVSGTLSTGEAVDVTLAPPSCAVEDGEQGGDPWVGRLTDDHWWVKALIADGPDAGRYLLSRGRGYEVDYRRLTVDELQKLSFAGQAAD